MAKKVNDKLEEEYKAYESLGLTLVQENSKEYKTICMWCDHAAMHVNVNGLYHCKHCGESGNKYSFLQAYYEYWFQRTKASHYALLSKDRNLPPHAFELADLAYDSSQKIWLIPVKNEKNSMVNLGRYSTLPSHPIYTYIDGGKTLVLGTSTCKASLFNLHTIRDSKIVYICEGPWDWIALDFLLMQNKIDDAVVLAVPGASIFPEDWVRHFVGKDVYLPYDNDLPGRKGMKRAADILRRGKVKKIYEISWPESYPSKFDVRDLVIKNANRPEKAWSEFSKFFQEVPVKTVRSLDKEIVRKSFTELLKDCHRELCMSQGIEETMVVICAVILSNYLFESNPYNPLWFFIVAPSSSGKTMLLQTTSDFDNVCFQGSLTPKTLVSGYRSEGGGDMSLLPLLIRKTLVIEDFTTIISLPAGDQEEIFGVLRSVYNGRYEKTYGSCGTRVYPEPGSEYSTCHFSILAGTTAAIHADRRSDLGERFLKWRIEPGDESPKEKIKKGMNNCMKGMMPEEQMRPYVLAFLNHMKDNIPKEPIEIPDEIQNKIAALAQVCAIIRAVVQRKGGDLLYRPEAEIGIRLGQQFLKIGQSIAFVLGKKSVDEDCYKYIKKTALDTCYGWHEDVLLSIYKFGREGCYLEDIAHKGVISRVTCHKVLDDLFELGAVSYVIEKNKPGRPRYRWTISSEMESLFQESDVLPKPGRTLIRKRRQPVKQ